MISLSSARRVASAARLPGWRFGTGDPIVPGRGALRLLGGGDRHEIYLAWDERLYAPVVAKLLRPHLAHDQSALAALAAEGAVLERLSHPGIVRSFGAVLDGDRPHLVLEFLDGPRMSTFLRDWGPLRTEQLIPLARQLCSVLQFVGGSGWVHLDIGPANVVMSAPPRLVGFAHARRIADARAMNEAVGTPAYRAPEARDPGRFPELGPAADVWSLGATMFEALTGRPARVAAVRRPGEITADGPPPLPEGVQPTLAAALAACLRAAPDERPAAAHVDELLEPLAAWAVRASRGPA